MSVACSAIYHTCNPIEERKMSHTDEAGLTDLGIVLLTHILLSRSQERVVQTPIN